MNQFRLQYVHTSVRKELDHIVSSVRASATTLGQSLRHNPSVDRVAQKVIDPPTIDPSKFKRMLLLLLAVLVVYEIVGALGQGMSEGRWSRFAVDLIIAGMLFFMWERITNAFRIRKVEYRRKMETSLDQIRLWDAFLFSLLWSDEIYGDIPKDRRRLVVISFTLIIIALFALYWSIGPSMMPLVIAGVLVLAAVNLLAWVVSLERVERESLQTELKLAHDVQVSLMPKAHPTLPGFDVAGLSLPAKEVGGDHFEYCCLGNDGASFGVSVFDVSGKGMQAAMSAVFTSGAFTSEVRDCDSPAEVLTNLNRSVFTHTKRGQFVAFLLSVIDTRTKTLTYANAGQMPPLLLSNGLLRWLQTDGVHFPLGMQEQTAYTDHTLQLHAQDVLLFFTDGFTEAMNVQGELFGNERIEQAVRGLDTKVLGAEALLKSVTQSVQGFVGTASQHDDMTMVVVKVG
jgi:serine phosphatase RsbU (regulator of sigma subunit)